jgi:hypothetical protein
MKHSYRPLKELFDVTDVQDLFDEIDARDQYISELEDFIEQDNDIKSAFEAWKEDWGE